MVGWIEAAGRLAAYVLEMDATMSAKIYRPAKTAMQSGKAKTQFWVLEFDQTSPRKIDPVMGYTTSADTRQQVKLTFETLDQAEAYAQREGIEYRVVLPKEAKRQVVSYTDNFRFSRLQPWTH
ncbi:ETC complex I subunit conserved region [Rhizobium sp. PDO1-076]|nr:ETC complex I subunit conserved region [Rhizobium sp. PDO1-076]